MQEGPRNLMSQGRSTQRLRGGRRWSSRLVGRFCSFGGNETDSIFRRKKGINRRYVVLLWKYKGSRLLIATAGSALIQACEKAGVTIPRYLFCRLHFLYEIADLNFRYCYHE